MALVALIGLCMASLCGVAGWQIYNSLFDAKRAELQHLAQTALSLIEKEHRRMVEGELSEAQAKARALEAVANLRYGGTNYFWINDMTPAMVMHPIKPALDGKDLSTFADPHGKRLFVAFVDVVKDRDAGFVSYAWPRPGSEEPITKESYVVGFAPWGWIIGTGIYVDDLIGKTWSATMSLIQMTFAILLVAGGIALWLSSSITRPLAVLTDMANRLANGEHVRVPKSDRDNEIGELTAAFEVFAARGLEAARLRSALDSCQVNVMVANRSLEIVYLNPNLQCLLQSAEAEIKKDLPQFSADQLLGANIDMFHKNPNHQRAMVADLDATHNVDIEMGGRRLALAVSPILSDHGERLGTVVEWQDRTAEVAALEEIDEVVVAASQGDLSRRLKLEGKQGFLLGLAKSINQLTTVVDKVTRDVGSLLEGLAEGDLSRQITSDYNGTFGDLKRNVNGTVHQLTEIVSDIQAAADEVKNAASEITSGTEDLSSRTEQAAANLEETAAAAEEMSATVKQNAANAGNASQLASSADQSAKTGGKVVEQSVTAMAQIEQSAQKITDIISVIDEIAFQTNLLALNASVEAARAGEAGKGFAVVAQEVRQLAQRSARAAADIKTLIEDSNVQVKDGVRLVNQAGEALSEIVGSIGKVAGIVNEISNASQEQASGIQEINSSITSMDEMTQQNSALVEESTAAARALSDQAVKLAERTAFFKLDRATSRSRANKTKAPQPTDHASLRSGPEVRPAPALAAVDDSWAEF